MDTMIDQELYKTFSHEQVQSFYDDFRADVSKYEDINSSAVETLFGFVNFDKFKQAILKYKSEISKAQKEEADSKPDTGFRIDEKKFYELDQEDVNDKASGWKNSYTYPEKDGFGLKMYQKAFKELNGRLVLKIQSVIRDYTIPMYQKFIKKIEKDGFESNKSVKEFKIIEREENKETGEEMSLLWVVSKIPLFSNRENLLRVRLRVIDGG